MMDPHRSTWGFFGSNIFVVIAMRIFISGARDYYSATRPRSRIWLIASETHVLKAIGLSINFPLMPRRFSIEVAKDYFNFASAHFLIFANGKREPLHGHNYQVSVAMEGDLDRAGVVLDFITFKPLVKQICDALDHRTLIQTNSSAIRVRKNARQVEILYKKQRLILPRGDVILLPVANTSTELLAEYIAGQIRRMVRRNFPAAIRYMEVAVEEARGQRGIFRSEF
jgi:6-pyruvoyltetrahydropterin/6-carboxytetrahydropterin synthase